MESKKPVIISEKINPYYLKTATNIRLFNQVVPSYFFPKLGNITRIGLICAVLLSISFISVGQTTYYWRTVAGSGNWTTAANWSTTGPGGGAAAASPGIAITDIAVFDGITGVTITVDADRNIGKLQVINNSNIILQPPNGSRTLTLNTNATDAFVLSTSSALDLTGNTGGPGRNLTLTFSAGINSNQTISGYFKISSNGGDGIFTQNNALITFDGTSTYEHARDGGAIPLATWDPTSLLYVTGIDGSDFNSFTSNQTFGDVTWDCPNQSTHQDLIGNASGIVITVKGNLNILNTGTRSVRIINTTGIPLATLQVEKNTIIGDGTNDARFYLNSGNQTTVLNLGGDLTVNLNGIFELQSGSSTVNFGIAGAANTSSWGGTGTYVNNGITYIINNVPAGKVVNLNGFSSDILLLANRPVIVNSGATLNCGTQTIGGTGAFTLQAGGILGIGHVNGLNGNIATTGTKTYNETGAGTTFIYNGTANQITGTNLPVTVTNLTIANTFAGGIVTLSNSTTINSILNLNSGVLSLGANNLTLINTATVGGNPPSTTNMVATGTGNFIKEFTTGDSPSFTYPIGDITATPDYSPVTLDFSSNDVAGSVGISVTDGTHPEINNGSTATDYLTRYWTYTTTGLTNYTYNVSTYQYVNDATDTVGTEAFIKLSFWNGSVWTSITNSSAGGGLLTITAPLDQGTGPLNGNTYTGRTICSYDTEDPTITCPPDVVTTTSADITGDCTTTASLGTPVTSDNCSVASVVAQVGGVTIDPVTYAFGTGITIVTWIVTDGNGNTASCDQQVTVTDDENPTITCPADVVTTTSANGTGDCTTTAALGSPITGDNCSVASVVAQVGGVTIDPVTYAFGTGVTTVTWIVTDGSGNTANCIQQVTVTDDENPTITCPADVVTTTSADGTGNCSTTAAVGVPVTGDNCGVTSVVAQVGGVTIDPVTYAFGTGLTVVTWIASDAAGNTASCTQNVTVTDDENPVALCKDISVALDALGNASITADDIDNGSTDNCGIASKSAVPNTFTIADLGPNNVTLTITDDQGNFSTCIAVVTVTTVPPAAYYSYQTGPWDQASTWTTDPGGTTGPGTTIPGDDATVVILNGRTVTLTADVTSLNLDVTINSGGVLDMSTFAFTDAGGLTALQGGGILKLSSANFPAAVTNTFVTTDAGTTEYNHNGDMSATQSTYYHLIIRSAGTVTQVSDVTLNGNLDVKQGIFRINDATDQRLKLIINGDVTVDNGCSIIVGSGVTTATASPLGINGSTGGFLDYYELHSHRVQIYGNFTNNGTVSFTNLSYPVFDRFPVVANGLPTGFATVYFDGAADKLLLCNGQTDFYNLVVDKGTDQTYKLTVNSAAYTNFRLFGANTSNGDANAPATNANPNLKKALWIKNGTMVLQGLAAIPSLTEGNSGGAIPSHFIIPGNGALQMDGAGVIVLSTANDYREVNGIYGTAAASNAAMGVRTNGGISGFAILGKLQINDGYLSTRESGGILYYTYAPGQFILNGGNVDAKQFHYGNANGLISYNQSGGTIELRGRLQRTTSDFTPAGIVSASLNTARTTNGISTGQGTLNIVNSAGANSYTMSGGTIRVFDVCNNVASNAVEILCSAAGINVTGGTVEIVPTTGTGLADANYLINSTAPFNNFIINRASSLSTVQLNVNPLVVYNDLTLTSGDFVANDLNVTVGGNFSIAAGTTYTPGTNTTIFNGTGNQIFTVALATPLSLNNLTADKPAGTTLTLAGTQTILNVLSDFRLVAATLDDNGRTVNIAGNVDNSGVHIGTGSISLNGTNLQIIDGGGIFQNLDLNNTNGVAAPVSLAADATINGTLTLSQNKLFDISTFNLKLNSVATIVNGGSLRYIKSAGNAGDGGLTKDYTATNTFTFPIGVNNYTPGTISFSAAPTTPGTITVVPVNYEHPNVTTTGRSLTYFWRTKSTGFTLGAATVTQEYTYADANVVTGGDVTEDGYVPARFNVATNTWTNGLASEVDEGTNKIGGSGSGTFLDGVSFIDGDYTAGDNDPVTPFGTPTIYYSRINGAAAGSGLWSNVNTWSTDPVLQHAGAPAGTVPGAADIVIIGGLDSIYLSNEAFPLPNNNNPPAAYFQLNKAVVTCASLRIEVGSCLDIQNNPGCNFAMVLNHPNGNGNFRVTTRDPVNFDTNCAFVFPSGDFSDFNVNRGTTEFYGINPQIGYCNFMPLNASSYGTVILSPLREANIALPNIPSLIIYGDLITRGSDWESWLAMTWTTGYGAMVPKTVSVNGDLLLQGGSFVWMSNADIQQWITIDGDVVVYPGAGIDIWSNSRASKMAIGGSLINNANDTPPIIAPWAGSRVRLWVSVNQRCDLEFFGPNNAFITNTGTTPATGSTPYTTLGRVTVNKGSSAATTLTCNIGGSLTTIGTLASPNDNWLTLQNGTFIYDRTEDFNITTGSQFTISATAGLTINTPSNVYIANAGVNTNDLILAGKLTLINGNVFVGQTPSTAFNNDIEYTSSGAASIDIQGGNLVVNGQIRRNPASAGSPLKYSQSDGSVTINGQAANVTNAKFEVLNAGSQFTMSGGTLTIVRGNGSTTTPSTPFGDLYIRPGTGSVTGGEIIFSHGGTAEQNYFLDANIPLNHLTITGAAGQTATVRLLTSPLVLNGNMTINANSVLNSNNVSITFNGNLINTPGLSGYIYGTNITTFNASNGGPFGGVQTITGTTDFYDLVVNPGTSLSLSNPCTINRNLTISSGSFILGANPVSLKGDLTNNATYTDDNSVGSGVLLTGTAIQHISGTGTFSRLTLDNAAGAQVENNISIQEDLTLNQGIFDIKKYLMTLGVNSFIQGAPFSASKMITSDGVFSDVGIRKFFNAGAINFLYPLGTSGKYTPALLNATTSNTVGFVRINNINSGHPAVFDPSNALDYYWEIQSSGITNFTGSLILNYYEEDVIGDEPNYLTARVTIPGSAWNVYPGVDPALNKITTNYTGSNNLSGEYTAGIASAFFTNVPEYTSNADGNWTNQAIWTQTGGDPYPCPPGGPNGFIVYIDHEVTLNANYCYAYRTTINDKLKVVSSFYGHNLGTVYGSGTLYLESGSFPAGVYTSFLDCANNATVEYSGTGTYTIVADLYDNISNIVFS
jgi:hypothetical protein